MRGVALDASGSAYLAALSSASGALDGTVLLGIDAAGNRSWQARQDGIFASTIVIAGSDIFLGGGSRDGGGADLAVSRYPIGVPFLRGDADLDGQIDLADAVLILEHAFRGGDAPRCLAAADANADGRIDITDAVLVLGFAFLGGPPPAAPYPACATDPADTLGCGAPGC